jgi:hypothetical protein
MAGHTQIGGIAPKEPRPVAALAHAQVGDDVELVIEQEAPMETPIENSQPQGTEGERAAQGPPPRGSGRTEGMSRPVLLDSSFVIAIDREA